MAKLTWLGEDELHTTGDGSGAGPSFTRAFGDIKFPKGVPVEISDKDAVGKDIIVRAKKNPFFKVDDEEKRGPGRPPKVIDGDENKG